MSYTNIQHPPPYHECGETSPYFSFPADITTIDPAWSACKINAYGGLDPPRAFTKTASLVQNPATSATPGPGSDLGTTAASLAVPGSRIGPAHASATVTSAAGSCTSDMRQSVPRPHNVPFDGVSAQEEPEHEEYNNGKDELNKAVTKLTASFVTVNSPSTSLEPDWALPGSPNRIIVHGASCMTFKPLSVSQALKTAPAVEGTSSKSSSPESASIMVDGNDHNPASLGFKQDSGTNGTAENVSHVETFTGAAPGREVEIGKLCIAFMVGMGFRAVVYPF